MTHNLGHKHRSPLFLKLWIAIAYGLVRGANNTHGLSNSCAAVIIRFEELHARGEVKRK